MIRAAALALVAAVAVAAPAHAVVVLEPADDADLANGLAEASDEQGVCYGWRIRLDDAGAFTEEVGSNFGPGVGATTRACPNGYAELVVDITYTCSSCEAEDRARFAVESDVIAAAEAERALRDLGYDDDDLLSDRDDDAIVSMAGALPVIVAEQKGKAFVPFETSTLPPAQRGMPTGSPGPDFLREHRWTLGLGLVLLLGGLGWWAYFRFRFRPPAPRPSRITEEET